MSADVDVIVVGAGLAGLASAILLARRGFTVLVFEQDTLPKHRVCGEYVSREVAPFVSELGLDLTSLGTKQLDTFELSTLSGNCFTCDLGVGGFGLSRYELDFALLTLAKQAGVQVAFNSAVKAIASTHAGFTITTTAGSLTARLTLGCFGKRSQLDFSMGRPHAKRRSKYVGVKRHFRGSFPQQLVSLHAIPDGYCGISAVERDLVNVCYLTSATALKANGSVNEFERRGLRANPRLAEYLNYLTPAFDPPLVVSQLNFEQKHVVDNHVLMLGDAAGLIHPLAGNGMAMAFRAAALAVPLVSLFLRGQMPQPELEARYALGWRREFRSRRYLTTGLQRLFESPRLTESMCKLALAFPTIARSVISGTHGRPF